MSTISKTTRHPLTRKQAGIKSLNKHSITIIVHDDYLYVEQEYVHTIEANTCVLTLKIAYLFHLIE